MFARARHVAFALLAGLMPAVAFAQTDAFSPTTSPVSPSGIRAVVDLPASQHMQNTGGSDGAGLCVFTSITHAGRWQNLINLDGYRAWMERRPGGGYPQKVDQTLAAYCRSKGVPVPQYIQHTAGDESFLDLAIKTGRCPCVTYAGRDDFYRSRIAHMVNLAHIDAANAAIIDNNRPGHWIWMTRAEFLARWREMQGGWAFVFLGPPPPPYTSTPQARACPNCSKCGENCQCFGGGYYCDETKCPIVKTSEQIFGQCANGQCINGRCYPASSPPFGIQPAPIGFPPSRRHFWGQFPNGEWGWLLGNEPAAVAGDNMPTGVVPDRIHEHPPNSLNGHECSREEAYAALLADDTDHWHLSAIGDSGFLAKFRADVAALPAEVRAKLLVQEYLPAAWQIAQFQLPAAGIALRKPTAGRVSSEIGVIAAAEYSKDRLVQLLGDSAGPAPRPPAPPAPAPAKPDAPPNSDPVPAPTSGVPPWCCCAGAVAMYVFLKKRKAT